MSHKSFYERIDDYRDSVFAIIGFTNLFRFDDETKKMRDDIKVYQGRRMRTSPSNRISPDNEVTPDFCIYDTSGKGVVGEVKKTFPENRDYWMDDFKQLMSYDDDFLNWMTKTGTIDDHEIVLLAEQTRSQAVKDYFEERKNKEILFTKNFVIVEFNRNDQVKAFFFFRKMYGGFKLFPQIDTRLYEGVPVPMEKLMPHYEKIKLYDAKPPLPYLLYLIWENVVMLRASQDERFKTARKLAMEITIDEIMEELHNNYSFSQLAADDDTYQTKIPPKPWIVESMNALITFKLAKWKDKTTGEYIVYFKKFKETLKTFIDLCNKSMLDTEMEKKQLELFDLKESL